MQILNQAEREAVACDSKTCSEAVHASGIPGFIHRPPLPGGCAGGTLHMPERWPQGQGQASTGGQEPEVDLNQCLVS